MKIDISDLEMLSTQLKNELVYFKNKSIFLTGGTGFFGKWLLESFSYLNTHYDLNIHVTVLSRSPERFGVNFPHLYTHEKFSFVTGDIRSFDYLHKCFDLIIHAATDASVELNRKNPELMYSTIMNGAKRICEFAKKVKCKRILYTSSGAAYGPQPSDIDRLSESYTENLNFNSSDAYASAKLKSEKYFTDNAHCDVVITRCFAFSGPYLPLDGAYAFGNFIGDALEGRNITIKGDGSAIRSYLYAADLVVWLLKALALGKDKSIYNVGSPDSVTTLDLARKISSDGVHVNVLNLSSDKGNKYVPCTIKSQNDLGVQVYTSLDDAIKKTLNFHRFLQAT